MEKSGKRVIPLKKYMQGFVWVLAFLSMSCSDMTDYQHPRQEQVAISPLKVGAIPLPEGYVRIDAARESYAAYLRNIPLKKDNTVYLYNGAKKRNQSAQYAVLDIDAGDKDLQQCADAAMRIRAEYLYAAKKFGDITFSFTNGFNCDYEHYASGYRLNMRGNNCNWVKQKASDYSYRSFRQYLDLVYSYAGTKSLHAQLKPVSLHALTPGKVFIQTGNPYGHAVTVMDVAYHPGTGDTIFLLSQSYMPAQDIHILRNPMNSRLSPWYSTRFESILETPEWTFYSEDLRSF